jgi:hypothetical protein
MSFMGQQYRHLSMLWQRDLEEWHAFAYLKVLHFTACLLEKRESSAAE